MKNLYTKIFLIIFIWGLSNEIKAQNTEFWGMTYYGGKDYQGVIFKTDENGENYSVEYEFKRIEAASSMNNPLIEYNNKLYGMSYAGGITNQGVIFEYDYLNNKYTTRARFNAVITGQKPFSSLILASNGKMYGTAISDGPLGGGTLFEYNQLTDTINRLFAFDYPTDSGALPRGAPFEVSNGKLYGTTSNGGINNKGIIYEYDLLTDSFKVKHNFDITNGSGPAGTFIEHNGKIYGIAGGGINNDGVLYEYNFVTDTFIKRLDLVDSIYGSSPYKNLLRISNDLYGLTRSGGANNGGTLYKYNIVDDTAIVILNFDSISGYGPNGIMQADNGLIYGTCNSGGVNDKGVIFEYNPTNDSYIKKYDFDTLNGYLVDGALMQASNGKFYATTRMGGIIDKGVLFEYDLSNNTYTKKLDLGYSINGANPQNSLTKINDMLYGTTYSGGQYDKGTVFKYNPGNYTYTKIIDFNGTNGASPYTNLIVGNNKLYGIAYKGGINDQGLIFEIDPLTDTYTKKIDLDSTNYQYLSASLLMANDNNLYGITNKGGINNIGSIFKYDLTNDTIYTIYNCDSINGYNPEGTLMQADNGKIYGFTAYGGTSNLGVIFELDILTNTYTKIFDFIDDSINGRNPNGTLIQVNNDKLYGYAKVGAYGYGLIFDFDLNTNTQNVLHYFNLTDGYYPIKKLLLASNGKLYGTTRFGGDTTSLFTYIGEGTIFEFDIQTNTLTTKHIFDIANGSSSPRSYLIEGVFTGINDIETNNNILIYPNPTHNLLNIVSENEQINNIQILDITGKTIITSSLREANTKWQYVDISNLSNGMYFIKINNTETVKFIKQ